MRIAWWHNLKINLEDSLYVQQKVGGHVPLVIIFSLKDVHFEPPELSDGVFLFLLNTKKKIASVSKHLSIVYVIDF